MAAAAAVSQPTQPPLATAEVLGLDCILFGVKPGVEPNRRPPVRIFLGTEEAQHRAERVFLYSVDKYRDPAREYRVYRMQDLPGFDRRGWRTGFTLYRFAIPELAGAIGRAIYNDVDQIYLEDPARLFDQDLDGHGYLSVLASDTSVMLLDCARMARWWNLAAARRSDKRALVSGPAAEPGLWGPLDGGWNARDDEYRPGASRLLHYTALHLQPWRPTPAQYSYHPHPLGALWFRLEREADVADFEPFTPSRPSAGYRALVGASVTETETALPAGARDFLAAKAICEPPLYARARLPPLPADGVPAVVVAGLLERLPVGDIRWVLRVVFAAARRAVYLHLDLRRSSAPVDRPLPPRLAQPLAWWRDRIAAVAERHPTLAWRLDVVDAAGGRHSVCGEPQTEPPTTWVLLGHHEGDNRQLLALADALGWPYRTHRLVIDARRWVPVWWRGASIRALDARCSEPLTAPWPQLVLACGGRAAPVARWIRRRAGGATRLVLLGRPRAPLSAFDLVVTTAQYQLPARANVVHNLLPLNRATPPAADAAAAWRRRVAALPRPWVALLVGGDSATSRLDDTLARRLRECAEARVRNCGGSLLIATSPRTPAGAADALVMAPATDVSVLGYRWRAGDPDNAYPVFIALADEFIVTGDSASMLAEACARGRPVRYVPLPSPPPRRRLRWRPAVLLARLLERRRRRLGERGTPAQQSRFERWFDALVAAGVLRPPRRLDLLLAALRDGGFAAPLDGEGPSAPPPNTDLERTVAAIRRLFARGVEVER